MGSVGAMGEEALIERLARELGAVQPPVEVGVGDDCAVLRLGDRTLLFATDTMVEGTHFTTDPTNPLTDLVAVGWRLGASNLSDLAAMGGRPLAAVISTALPAEWPVTWVEQAYEGLRKVGDRHDLPICGGDVVRINGPAALTLAVLGEVDGEPVLRSGGRPGDLIAVTGDLGASRACLRGVHDGSESRVALLRRGLWPMPRLEWGQALRGSASAMMDLSDGLATDLPRLARASGVGVVVREANLPVSDALVTVCGSREAAQREALIGGEDYELLVTLPKGSPLPEVPLSVIGELTAAPSQMEFVGANGEHRPLSEAGGWSHFGSAS